MIRIDGATGRSFYAGTCSGCGCECSAPGPRSVAFCASCVLPVLRREVEGRQPWWRRLLASIIELVRRGPTDCHANTRLLLAAESAEEAAMVAPVLARYEARHRELGDPTRRAEHESRLAEVRAERPPPTSIPGPGERCRR